MLLSSSCLGACPKILAGAFHRASLLQTCKACCLRRSGSRASLSGMTRYGSPCSRRPDKDDSRLAEAALLPRANVFQGPADAAAAAWLRSLVVSFSKQMGFHKEAILRPVENPAYIEWLDASCPLEGQLSAPYTVCPVSLADQSVVPCPDLASNCFCPCRASAADHQQKCIPLYKNVSGESLNSAK